MSKREEKIVAMKKELDAYKNGTSSAKPFFTTMQELSSWLETKANIWKS